MRSSPRSLVELSETWRSAYPAPECIDLQISGCGIRVRSNSAALIGELERYYRAFLQGAERVDIEVTAIEGENPEVAVSLEDAPPGPGKSHVKEAIHDFSDGRLLRKTKTGLVFLFSSDVQLAIGRCLDNLAQVVNFVNNRYMQWQIQRGYLLCHAAGVSRENRGLMLAGVSGRGKSTLALHLVSSGADFVSNDRLLIQRVDGQMRMLGVPKFPRVNPGTILNNPQLSPMLSEEEEGQFARLSSEELWNLEYKYDVDIDEQFGTGRFKLAAEMVAVVILTWSREESGPPLVRRADLSKRRDLLQALMKPIGVHYCTRPGESPPRQTEEDYIRMLGGYPVYEVAGGVDFASAAASCDKLIGAALDQSQTA